jgi:uncharacterized protein YjiS (DUF1127 family)
MKSQLLMSFWGMVAGYVAAVPAEADLASRSTFSILRRPGKRMAGFLAIRRKRLDESHLQRLSDHLLKDIGLDRSELHYGVSRSGRRHA